MASCQICNIGCQFCYGCQSCNSCQSCNITCNGTGCNTVQNFCTTNQSVGSFSFDRTIEKDALFFTHKEWNSLITYINNAYAKGAASLTNNAKSGTGVSTKAPFGQGGDSGLPEADTNTYMTAAMFNAVATALQGLGGSTGKMTKKNVTKDVDIVYGSYFTGLENYANGLKYKESQCDNCNIACNVQCNTCLTCNNTNCGSCNSRCQADATTSC